MTQLSALPPVVFLQILKHLELGDKVRLSATCKGYRSLLSPDIFTTIHFTNNEASAKSALAAVEAHGEYTTRIKFTCHAASDAELTAPALPLAASKVLDGHYTPNLHTVQLKFDFDFDDGEDWDDNSDALMGSSIYVFEAVESEAYVRTKEKEFKWRALMNETWQALTTNKYVRDLLLDEFIPKWTSTFRTDDFRQFLSQLESAAFTMFGMDNGAGWKTNTVWGYVEFLAGLDNVFFQHMHRLKHLHILASVCGPIGLEGFRHIPLALQPGNLPVLESLKLENCFVGPELVSFVQGHASSLASLDVKDCVSGGDGYGMAENSLYWAQFFDEIYDAKPSLIELIAEGGRVPLTSDEQYSRDYIAVNEPEEVQDIRMKLKANPKLRLFGYAYLDDKYGMFFMDEEANVEEFHNGDDQRAYDRLMGFVKANAARGANAPETSS
ncbi:hypothetical protein PT974_03473 [Cladobotryum mycophilum]|uniref:F-box domain-containing protein n=1 Tax=Cladobotryum mycophilum TaxID=491253 RepID=A0ABR0SSE1_9HYPO